MVRADTSQSLNDFRDNWDQTLDRLNRTGDAEVLTQDGQPRAIVLSPRAFDELNTAAALAQRLATIQQAESEATEGKGRPADDFFDELRRTLMSQKARQA
jgi:PHD/YefM family antitoxin component YafN of YafNO toxin-antitoxin module